MVTTGYQTVSVSVTAINQGNQRHVETVGELAQYESFSRARVHTRKSGFDGNSVTGRYIFLFFLQKRGFQIGWRRLAASTAANRNKQIGK